MKLDQIPSGQRRMSREEYLDNAHALAARGNQLPHAKLTPDIVRAIRANKDDWTARQWAAHLGVHRRTIDAVREYRNWGWVR